MDVFSMGTVVVPDDSDLSEKDKLLYYNNAHYLED